MRRSFGILPALFPSWPWFLGATVVIACVGSVAEARSEPASGPCGLSEPAFCDTFDQPAGTGNRSGQLSAVWGVSRINETDTNSGQGQFNAISATELKSCTGTSTVRGSDDVIICNGQLREALNDNESVATLAMYPKQPFDFAERTGTIVFDVSNDTLGQHSQWPELWITDQPVPAPFAFFNATYEAPRNGVGLRFASGTVPQQGTLLGGQCPNDANPRWTLAPTVVVRNYVVDDEQNGGLIKTQVLDCVTSSSGPDGGLNHIEVQISQNQIDVYATDAGTTAPLKHIAVVPNVNLSFTRGLVWIEDDHYHAAKFGGQRQHTFTWDNFGFDGPVLPRDLAFDVADAMTPVANHAGQVNIGWLAHAGAGPPLIVPEVTGIERASAALLTFNFAMQEAPSTFTYTINGSVHSAAWPFPDKQGYMWRTLAVSIPLNELQPGANTVSIAADLEIIVANVDVILVGAD